MFIDIQLDRINQIIDKAIKNKITYGCIISIH